MEQLSDSEMKTLLTEARKIAVIGLSPVPARPSFGVTRYMIDQGYEIFGVRPASPPEILGRPCVEALADLGEDVDIIDVFRNSDAIPQVVDDLEKWVAKFPRRTTPRLLWLQEGVSHPEAEERASRLGFKVVANRCILKDHMRLCR